jgi:F0F1-type ATP synthase gamma subunit
MDKKTITKDISDLENLKNLANSYAQISSHRMRTTRESVLNSREFLAEINTIFLELQASYNRQFMSLARKKGFRKGEKITLLNHNGKDVAVFISANTAFYGDLTKKVFDLFIDEINNKNIEATIVGSLGLNMFRQIAPDKSYSYFDLPDYGMDRDKMSSLVKHLVQYERIHIFYGKFKSLISQLPDQVVISAETPVGSYQMGTPVKYLFEPSLEEILMFFETEMFSSIFEQTINESQLAKFASRMIAMDLAGEKIKKSLDELKLTNSRINHNVANKKQLQSLSIMSARRFV